jgi:cation transport ATPase-like protein
VPLSRLKTTNIPSLFRVLPVTLDLSELDWHRVSIDEALRRLAVAPKTGLDAAQAQRRTAQYGANQISPPPRRILRKVIGWIFGGFGSLLLAASVVCFIAWYGISLFLTYVTRNFGPAGSRWEIRTRRRLTLLSPSSFSLLFFFRRPLMRGKTFRPRASWLPSRVCSLPTSSSSEMVCRQASPLLRSSQGTLLTWLWARRCPRTLGLLTFLVT